MQTNVIIADDHPLFRAAMRQALAEVITGDIYEVASMDEVLNHLHIDPSIDLVFLDINMPGNQGLSGLLELQATFPDVLVTVVSAEDSPELIHNALSLGASGYIPKSTPLNLITQAVAHLLEGKRWLPECWGETLETNSHEQTFARGLSELTPHQFKVLKMIAEGLLNKQIAYELSISESTVKQHVSAVLRKLAVVNRTRAGVLFNQLTRAPSLGNHVGQSQ